MGYNLLLAKRLDSSVSVSVPVTAATGNMFLPLSLLGGRVADEYKFAMRDNWDGQGAKAVSRAVVTQAESLITKFGGMGHLVEIAPGVDGSLSFIWDDKQGNYIYLDVGPGETVHLFYEAVGEAKWEGVSVANDIEILRHLRKAFAKLYPSQQVVIRFAGSPSTRWRQLYPSAA